MYSVQGVFTLEPVYLITDREYSCAIIIYFELPRDGTIILFLRKKNALAMFLHFQHVAIFSETLNFLR